ncbi:MAG: response regulator transcription factor [Flavobacteriaceae bacterium]|nr:response regulator transcription factor [Flavobacteriaceae bacterium]
MIKVGITDDHRMVIRGLETMLEDIEDIEIISKFYSAKEVMNNKSLKEIDVMLLDIQLEDGNGFDLCKTIKEEYPKMKILALSNYGETAFVKQMIRNGANGYLLKNTSKDQLYEAIRSIYQGEQYIQKSIQKKLLNESIGIKQDVTFIPKLTRREKEILELIIQEKTTNEIADDLCISSKTVETHRSHLIQKLGVRNTAGLVRLAIEKGLLD